MTWEEFKEKAKKLGAIVLSDMVIYKSVMFLENGEIDTSKRIFNAKQMLMIMEALRNDRKINM